MEWDNLVFFRCPKPQCGHYLHYKKSHDLWVCQSDKCEFAIKEKKRGEIAGKSPLRNRTSNSNKYLKDALTDNT